MLYLCKDAHKRLKQNGHASEINQEDVRKQQRAVLGQRLNRNQENACLLLLNIPRQQLFRLRRQKQDS
jgi:hypothetical protein